MREPGSAEAYDKLNEEDARAIIPFDPWNALQPPSFPMTALPIVLQAFAQDRAMTIGADPAALAWSAISACSAAIDARILLQMKQRDDWTVPPMIWLALIGPPSTKKTPIIRATWGLLEREQQIDLDAWKGEREGWKKLPKKEQSETPEPVCRRRLITHSATPEAVRDILARQERGIGVLHDELAGWIGMHERYTHGRGKLADRAFWLQAFDGGPYFSDRVDNGTTALSNLSAVVCGGIQPDRLKQLGDLTDDGLWQRFITIIVAPPSRSQDIDHGCAVTDYHDLIPRLLALDPRLRLQLSSAAHAIREDVERQVFELEQSEILGPRFAGFCGKLLGLWGRLALVLNCIEPSPHPHIIGDCTADAARILLFNSVVPNAARVYIDMGAAGSNPEATQSIAGFILVKELPRLVASDLSRNVRACRKGTLEEIQKLVSPLVAGSWLTPETEFNPTAWRVNPTVHARFAARAQQEAKRRETIRGLITGSAEQVEAA
jgi:Protein of unknown function (DUF3987)